MHGGAATFEDLFAKIGRMGEARFLGETALRLWIDRLRDVRGPLLANPPCRLNDAGRKVLAGQLSRPAINGIDRWMDGIPFISG